MKRSRIHRHLRNLSIASLAYLMIAGTAGAETFRFAYQADVNSLDPYALNETFSHSFQGNVYESLVDRDQNLVLGPGLAESWEQVEPEIWRFHLRPGVKFHEGQELTASDVVFSYQRAIAQGSDVATKLASVKEARIVDDLTVDFITNGPNPIFPHEITTWYIMSAEWAEANGATEPTSVKAGVENFATRNANGTGPFRIVRRVPDVTTILEPNPDWWGEASHNLTEIVFTPISSDATRVAALLSGEVDMAYPIPLQDAGRLQRNPDIEFLQGPELRTIALGMDVFRDELLESSVKGKNPFKDKRVRQAFYQAIDIEAIRDVVMRGGSTPTALMVAPGINGHDPSLNERLPFDPEAAKELLVEAGYGDGFQVGMDCPNDRYVNDADICQAVVAMLAKIGVDVNLLAQTRTRYFEKMLSKNTSMFMVAWQPSSYDAHSALFNLMNTPPDLLPEGTVTLAGQGSYNSGGYSNPKVDELTEMVRTETDPDRRQELISEAFSLHKEDIGHLPLHQQALAWGVRNGIDVVQRADDSFQLRWVTVNKN